jgi:uncharacterized protein
MTESELIIDRLKLHPHPEGGYFKEIYRSDENINKNNLPDRYSDDRKFSTSIYFLLNKEDKSHFHKLASDEIWHFYNGSPIVLHCIDEDGNYSKQLLGNNFKRNENPQIIISKGTWFAAEVENKNSYTLLGCTVSPGFEFSDFELGLQGNLLKLFPQHSEMIKNFT